MRLRPILTLALSSTLAAVGAIGACSSEVTPGAASSGASSAGGASSTSTSTTGNTGGTTASSTTTASSSSTGQPFGCTASPDEDKDMDGWSIAQGDCDDCEPHINPGAIELPTATNGDGGLDIALDEDCDGIVDNVPPLCDDNLALGDLDPLHAAAALDLCKTTTAATKLWGVIHAEYVAADGTPRAPGLQTGLLSHFGTSVNPRAGQSMLALSTGRARDLSAPAGEPCGSPSCSAGTDGNAPMGFPISFPGCTSAPDIHDDVGLQIDLRAPTDVLGYSFDFKFHSFAFPAWVCTPYSDQFVALMAPSPPGAINADVAFDTMGNPVGVNLLYFDVCDPSTLADFAKSSGSPPPAPNPFCPTGPAELAGTGFDVWGEAGATSWIRSTVPVKPGSEFSIRFALWDAGDHQLDSTVLIDHFAWLGLPGPLTGGCGGIHEPPCLPP